jgi:hypothetical protein
VYEEIEPQQAVGQPWKGAEVVPDRSKRIKRTEYRLAAEAKKREPLDARGNSRSIRHHFPRHMDLATLRFQRKLTEFADYKAQNQRPLDPDTRNFARVHRIAAGTVLHLPAGQYTLTIQHIV